MFILDLFLELAGNIFRSILIDGLCERVSRGVRRIRFGRRLRGMDSVRRHIRQQCRRKLFRRLST